MNTNEYFQNLEREVRKVYSVAEAAREKGEIEGGPVVEGKSFNWKEASSKKKS